MEMFLMAAISRGGLNTLYAFQQTVGLQPGSLKPVLGQLEKDGLLVRWKGAKRGRRVMTLTKHGETFIAKEWRGCLDPRREMESILRSTTVALLMDDAMGAVDFLLQSASERVRRAAPSELAQIFPEREPIDLHAELRTVYESRRRVMEAEVLEEFARKIKERFEKSVK
jgi:DNA-binding PadR family transcriptional regulator